MARYNIVIGDRLFHENRDMRFERRRGDHMDFLHPQTNELLSLTDAELATLIACGQGRLIRNTGSRVPALDDYRESDLEQMQDVEKIAALRRLAYVEGAIERDMLLVRPSYKDLQNSINVTGQRRLERAEDLPSVRSLQRWIVMATEKPSMAKLASKSRLKGNVRDRLHPEVRTLCREMIEEHYLNEQRMTAVVLRSLINNRIDEINAERDIIDRLTKPGQRAINSVIQSFGEAYIMECRFGTARAIAVYSAVRKRKDPVAPLDVVEIDHTIADLFVIDDINGLPIGRPTIAMAVDRCTRMPFGIYIGFEPPGVHTVMQCLKNGVLPKDYVDEMVANGSWKIKNRWPVSGRPHALHMDRAMENLGNDIAELAAALPIKNLIFAPRKTPQHKGAIERFLGTLNRNLLQQRPGTTFSNVMQRYDYNPAKNAIITLNTLQELLHRWLIDDYAQRIHKGIRNAPAVLWAEKVKLYPVDPLENRADLDTLFGKTKYRTLRRNGINLNNIAYCSDELDVYRLDPEYEKQALRTKSGTPVVRVRFSTEDISRIQVHLAAQNRYIEVPVDPAYADYVNGLSLWEHINICRSINDRNDKHLKLAQLDRARAELIETVVAGLGWQKKSGARKKFARFVGIGRVAFAGGNIKTIVPNSLEDLRQKAAAPDNAVQVLGVESSSDEPQAKTRRAKKQTPTPPAVTVDQIKLPPRSSRIIDSLDDDENYYVE